MTGAGHAGHGVPAVFAALAVVGAAGYVWAARRVGRGGARRWDRRRSAAFVTGTALLALSGGLPAAGSFPAHVLQHVLTGMLAPLALVLGAPVTLLVRVVDRRTGRALVRLLRSAPVRAATHPVTALLLGTGGLWLLYLTPLYRWSTEDHLQHAMVHAHFLLGGCLFVWAVAGTDPVAHRPSPAVRLTVLGLSVAGHAALSQLLYAGLFVDVPVPAGELRDGATLMYYLGDLSEILTGLALLATLRPARSPSEGRHVTRPVGAWRAAGVDRPLPVAAPPTAAGR